MAICLMLQFGLLWPIGALRQLKIEKDGTAGILGIFTVPSIKKRVINKMLLK